MAPSARPGFLSVLCAWSIRLSLAEPMETELKKSVQSVAHAGLAGTGTRRGSHREAAGSRAPGWDDNIWEPERENQAHRQPSRAFCPSRRHTTTETAALKSCRLLKFEFKAENGHTHQKKTQQRLFLLSTISPLILASTKRIAQGPSREHPRPCAPPPSFPKRA